MHTILIAEDDPLTMESLVERLTATGYTVVQAWDGQEAMAKLGHHKVDLVVTDQQMPRVTGTELAEKMSADPKLRNIPVLIRSSLYVNWKSPNVRGHIQKGMGSMRNLCDAIKGILNP